MRISMIRLHWTLRLLLHRSALRRIRRLSHLPLRHRIIALVACLRLLLDGLWTIRDSLARSRHIAVDRLLRSRRSLIGRLRRLLSRRTRHLAIARVSVLSTTIPGWALRLLATMVGITVVGVLSLTIAPIGAVATATVAAVVASLRALAWVGLVVTRGAWLRVVMVRWSRWTRRTRIVG